MAGTGFHSFVANRAPIPRFATKGIASWLSALKFILLIVVIRGEIIFFVIIRGTHLSSVCQNQYQPFYINSLLVHGQFLSVKP
jgi:hypothetical protein